MCIRDRYIAEDNTLNVHISNLRNKLKAICSDTEFIATVWGIGYRLHKACLLYTSATESSIRSIQEQSKKLVTGKLKEVAYQKIDDQTEALVSMIGDNQVDYRFFLGFKLMVTEDEVNLKNIKKSVFLTFREFLNEVRHTLVNLSLIHI